jgi:hypothetical protein
MHQICSKCWAAVRPTQVTVGCKDDHSVKLTTGHEVYGKGEVCPLWLLHSVWQQHNSCCVRHLTATVSCRVSNQESTGLSFLNGWSKSFVSLSKRGCWIGRTEDKHYLFWELWKMCQWHLGRYYLCLLVRPISIRPWRNLES